MTDEAPASPAAAVYEAKVVWYDPIKGYGFMFLEGYPREVLVHNTEVRNGEVGRDYLLKKDHLRCRVGLHNGRPCCIDLEMVEPAG